MLARAGPPLGSRCRLVAGGKPSPWGEGGAPARRMRGKCPESCPSSVTCGDSFPQRGKPYLRFPRWVRVAARSRAAYMPPLQMTRKIANAAKPRAGHAPPLLRSKKQRPLPRPYIAPIPNVRARRAHLNFYLLSFISYLKTTPLCAYCAGRQIHFTPSTRRNRGCRSYPAPAPACAKTSAYTRDNR